MGARVWSNRAFEPAAMPMIAIAALLLASDQVAPRAVRLDHYSAPESQRVQSTITCDNRVTRFDFVADRKGVRLLKPLGARDPASRSRLIGLSEKLGEIGQLRDWRVTCLGRDAIVIFRGFAPGSRPVVLETFHGLISDYHDRDPLAASSYIP